MADFKINPTPGYNYAVKPGDTFRRIAKRAYANEMLWLRIYRSNLTTLKSTDADILSIGEVLYIPKDDTTIDAESAAVASKYSSKKKGDFTLVIDGKEVPALNGNLLCGIDYLASSWTAEIVQKRGADPKLDRLVRPFSYEPAQLYLGSKLRATGRLYTVTPHIEEDSITKTLEFFTNTADLIDSPMPPPYEYEGNLKVIAKALCEPLGYQIVFNIAPGASFDFVTATKTETIGTFLIRLAKQRGMLVTTDEYGRIVFMHGNENGSPVDTLEEGKPRPLSLEAKFNGRERFGTYMAYGWSGDADDISSIAKDSLVPSSRKYTFIADDTDEANASITAKWYRAKTVSDALSIPYPVSDWYNSHGNMWMPNTNIIIKSPSLDIPEPTKFLIKDVGYKYSGEGRTSTLYLIPPWALSGGEMGKEPWA